MQSEDLTDDEGDEIVKIGLCDKISKKRCEWEFCSGYVNQLPYLEAEFRTQVAREGYLSAQYF